MWWMLALLPEPDLSALSNAADQALDYQGSCLVAQGSIALEYRALGVFHDIESYTLTGRLEGGVWQELALHSVDPGDPGSSIQVDQFPAIPPLFGRRPPPDYSDAEAPTEQSPIQPLEYVIDSLRGEVSTLSVRPGQVDEQEAYVLERSLGANNRRGELMQEVWVLPGGQVRRLLTQADSARSEHMLVRELRLDQRLDAQGLPQEERIAFKVRIRGIPLHVEQHTLYKSFIPCEDTLTQ